MKLEEYLDIEFELLGITPHITHLKMPENSYFNMITVATRHKEPYDVLMKSCSVIFADAYRAKKVRHNLGRFVVSKWAGKGYGVSPCHPSDQFDRWHGRVVAKGRLLKVLRAERLKRAALHDTHHMHRLQPVAER